MPPFPAAISVVIPVLDEERRIGAQLARLAALAGLHEVIVADGGSTDGTVALARAAAGVIVLEAPRGRAAQMNAGARVATGDVFLFLHADVTLPPDAAAWIGRALAAPDVVAGSGRSSTWPTCARGTRACPTGTRRSSCVGRRSRARVAFRTWR